MAKARSKRQPAPGTTSPARLPISPESFDDAVSKMRSRGFNKFTGTVKKPVHPEDELTKSLIEAANKLRSRAK